MKNQILFFLSLFVIVVSCKKKAETSADGSTFIISEKDDKWSIHKVTDSGVYRYDRVYDLYLNENMDKTIHQNAIVKKRDAYPTNSDYFFVTEIADPKTWESMYGLVVDDVVLFEPGQFDSYELLDAKENGVFIRTKKGTAYSVYDIYGEIIVSATDSLPNVARWNEAAIIVNSAVGKLVYTFDGQNKFGPYENIYFTDGCLNWRNKNIAGLIDLKNSNNAFTIEDNDRDMTFYRYDGRGEFFVIIKDKSSMWGIVDKEGKIIISPNNTARRCFVTDSIVAYIEKNFLTYCTLYNGQCYSTDIKVSSVGDKAQDGLFTVAFDNKTGVFDFKSKKLLLPMEYIRVDINEKNIECKKSVDDAKWGVFDFSGKFIMFDYVY